MTARPVRACSAKLLQRRTCISQQSLQLAAWHTSYILARHKPLRKGCESAPASVQEATQQAAASSAAAWLRDALEYQARRPGNTGGWVLHAERLCPSAHVREAALMPFSARAYSAAHATWQHVETDRARNGQLHAGREQLPAYRDRRKRKGALQPLHLPGSRAVVVVLWLVQRR
jgi:hypothetical protein